MSLRVLGWGFQMAPSESPWELAVSLHSFENHSRAWGEPAEWPWVYISLRRASGPSPLDLSNTPGRTQLPQLGHSQDVIPSFTCKLLLGEEGCHHLYLGLSLQRCWVIPGLTLCLLKDWAWHAKNLAVSINFRKESLFSKAGPAALSGPLAPSTRSSWSDREPLPDFFLTLNWKWNSNLRRNTGAGRSGAVNLSWLSWFQ